MTDIDRQSLLIDPTRSETYPGLYIPLETIDRNVFEIIHPENAFSKLNMSARTAYRRIDAGELEYTIEQGAKRIVVRKGPTNKQKPVGQPSDNNKLASQKNDDFDRFLDKMPDFQTTLSERDNEIKELRSQYAQMLSHHYEDLESLRRTYEAQSQSLREALETERIKNAKLEAQLEQIQTMQSLVETQKETITTQKTTIDALNNERVSIHSQLQKYRENPSADRQSDSSKSWFDRILKR